ncbi:MAG: hypothetical protein K5761_00390 [Clostridiales bacterium]|nr:hypothetical protein [Clostridiales bacterium]
MAATCPECGYKLHFWEVKAECPKCGINIPNHKWEQRLDADADTAEEAFAKMHYKTRNFKSAVVGSKLRIARLVMTFAPLIALVLPLYKVEINLPFYHETETISFLTFVMNYLLKTDIGSVLALLKGDVLGHATLLVFLACIVMLLSVASAVLNFFVLLISGMKLRYMLNIILNLISTVGFASVSVFFILFTKSCEALGGGILTNGSVQPIGFIVGCLLFFTNLTLNCVVGRSLKKEKKEQPSQDEFVKAELEELHKN